MTLFTKRKKGGEVTIYTKNISKQLKQDVLKFNKQYEPIEIEELNESHDRFLLIDNNELYHIGASLKDVGKRWFAFSKMDTESMLLLEKFIKWKVHQVESRN